MNSATIGFDNRKLTTPGISPHDNVGRSFKVAPFLCRGGKECSIWISMIWLGQVIGYRHNELSSRFGEFALLVKSKVGEQSFHIKGITTSQHLDKGYFTTTFAGRTIVFVFTSLLEGSGNLK